MNGRELRQRRSLRALPGVVRALALEFGPAEALDTLLLRPAAVYAGLRDGRRTLLPVAGALVSLSLAAASLA